MILLNHVCVCATHDLFVLLKRTTANLAIAVKCMTVVPQGLSLSEIDCAHMAMHARTYVRVCVRPDCVCDICRHMCVHLWLLLLLLCDLMRSLCECGSGRPLACLYVLMLHIWFPNFLPPLSGCPPSPPTRVRTLFCFFKGIGRRVVLGLGGWSVGSWAGG